jgi:zinc/manganese transport system ATP-binding protein
MSVAKIVAPAPAMAAAVEVHNLTVAYDRHPAVHHVSGSFAPGSLTAIVGPNGAGKSSLLKAMAGLIQPAEGEVRHAAPGRLAYLPQAAEIDRDFPISIIDLVRMGHWRRVGLFGRIDRTMRDAADAALHAVGLDGFGPRPIGTLSVGQFQRALFARLMLQDAQVILLDEPFAAVDERTTADLLGLVARWHEEGRTVIAVLHDIEQVRRHFPEAVLMARHVLAWGPSAEALRPDLLQQAGALAGAWHDHAPVCATAPGP